MLASLINPALFAVGAAAVSVPIIIHLLARRRYKRIKWAAMEFLLDAEKRNRRRVQIEELILLALRCLAMLLIGVVLARPFFEPTGVAKLLGGRGRTERVFLFDDSFSMGYTTDGVTAFARARTSLVNLLNRVREHAPEDTVTLIRTSKPADPIVAGAVLDDQQTEKLLAQIEALRPSEQGISVEACMQGAAKAVSSSPGAVSAAVYLLSDFQRVNWVEAGGGAAATGAPESRPASALADPLRQWAAGEKSLRVMLIDIGDDDAENFAVTDLTSGQRQVVTGVEAPLEAQVANYTRHAADNVELQVTVGQTHRSSAPIAHLPAGTVAAAGVSAFFPHAGDEVVRVELPADNLPIDNARDLALEVSDAIRILIVNGEQSGDPYLDEAHLLVTALGPQGDVFSGNRVEVIDEAALDSVALERFHLVILCNLYRVSEPVADALHHYVFNGGGLAIFLGDQVSDPLVYNAALYRGGKGLLPAELGGIVNAPDAGVSLAGADLIHPVVRVFAGEGNPFLDRVRFRRYYALEPAPADQPVEGAAPAAYRPAANVIARFNAAEPAPAIVERAYGKGRVMLYASSADMEWNDWPRDPSYVVSMLEMVQHLARTSSANRAATVGAPLTLELDPAEYEPAAIVRSPNYPQQQEEEITATPTDSGRLQINWPHTDHAGVYTVVLQPRSGADSLRRFAVNLDERESDLAPATEDELRAVFAGLPTEYVAGIPAAQDATDEGRKETWPFFLTMLMTVLMGEQFLAWWFGRR